MYYLFSVFYINVNSINSWFESTPNARVAFGGVSLEPDVSALAEWYEVLVAIHSTPLECRSLGTLLSIDIALLWSGILKRTYFDV